MNWKLLDSQPQTTFSMACFFFFTMRTNRDPAGRIRLVQTLTVQQITRCLFRSIMTHLSVTDKGEESSCKDLYYCQYNPVWSRINQDNLPDLFMHHYWLDQDPLFAIYDYLLNLAFNHNCFFLFFFLVFRQAYQRIIIAMVDSFFIENFLQKLFCAQERRPYYHIPNFYLY